MFPSCCFLPDPATPLPRSPGTPPSSNWPSRHSAGCCSPPRPAPPAAPTCPATRRPPGNGPRQRRGSWPQTALPRPIGRRTPPRRTPASPVSLHQTFLGAFEHESQTVEVVQASAAAQADAQTVQDKLTHHLPPEPAEGSSWPVRCPTWQATTAPPLSNPPAAPRRGRGGTPGLLEYQGCGPSLAEGGGPSANGVGVPFQCPGYRRTRPSLGQQQQAYHRSRSRDVGDRIIRRRKSLASICHCSRNRSISRTPITNPSRTPAKTNPVPPSIYPMFLRISPWLWFRTSFRSKTPAHLSRRGTGSSNAETRPLPPHKNRTPR